MCGISWMRRSVIYVDDREEMSGCESGQEPPLGLKGDWWRKGVVRMLELGEAIHIDERGEYMMTAIPTRQITAPTTSNRAGLVPSAPHPQSSERMMNIPP